MTQSDYNHHVTNCAQVMLTAYAGNKPNAKAYTFDTLIGMRDVMCGQVDVAVQVIQFSSHQAAAYTQDGTARVRDVAYAMHVADVQAKIDTL